MADKRIWFPGFSPEESGPENREPDAAPVPEHADDLDEDTRKALGLIHSGMSYVLVAIKPTESGADFFTVVKGDADDLRNAQSHLPDVIGRAYGRKGIV